jgi:hypothetical protein
MIAAAVRSIQIVLAARGAAGTSSVESGRIGVSIAF